MNSIELAAQTRPSAIGWSEGPVMIEPIVDGLGGRGGGLEPIASPSPMLIGSDDAANERD